MTAKQNTQNKRISKQSKEKKELVDEQNIRHFLKYCIVFWPKETNHSTATKCWATRLNIKQENLFDKNKETKKHLNLKTLMGMGIEEKVKTIKKRDV